MVGHAPQAGQTKVAEDRLVVHKNDASLEQHARSLLKIAFDELVYPLTSADRKLFGEMHLRARRRIETGCFTNDELLCHANGRALFCIQEHRTAQDFYLLKIELDRGLKLDQGVQLLRRIDGILNVAKRRLEARAAADAAELDGQISDFVSDFLQDTSPRRASPAGPTEPTRPKWSPPTEGAPQLAQAKVLLEDRRAEMPPAPFAKF